MGVVVCPCPVLAVASDIKYRAQASGASIFVGDSVSISKFKTVQHECPNIRMTLQAAGSPVEDVLQYRAEMKKIPVNFVFKDSLPKTKWSDPSVIYFTSGMSFQPTVLHISDDKLTVGNRYYWHAKNGSA